MSGIYAITSTLPAGGGAYALPDLTVGVFLNDQPQHCLSLGSDRRRHLPLARHEGWILPAGADGLCEFDAPLDVTMVSIPATLFGDVAPAAGAAEPVVGALDPMLIQMVLGAERFGAGGTLYAQTMHYALAAHVAQLLAPAPPGMPAVDDARLRRAVDYIKAHLAEDLSLDAMAGVAAMSPSHFARAFRRATGTSPLQFVIAERLETAMVILRTTQLSVAEVAGRVGYHDVSRFTQHFKRRFGRSPGTARGG